MYYLCKTENECFYLIKDNNIRSISLNRYIQFIRGKKRKNIHRRTPRHGGVGNSSEISGKRF